MPLYVLAAAIGAAIAYLFDPESGRRRRKILSDKAGKFARQGGQRAQDAAAQAGGMKQKATHLKEQKKPQPDDVTLARKVETFGDADVPKGKINVNVEDGVVYLRGELEQPDLIQDLESQARKVQGVRDVENLLHTPGDEAPAKAE
jgi:osmotically-inducible protein OsmY